MSRPQELSDEDHGYAQQRNQPKKGGYDSRIEQILYENQDLQILITDAGKNHESGGSYIAYTIRTGVCDYCKTWETLWRLTSTRTSRCGGAILNSVLCEQHLSIFTLR